MVSLGPWKDASYAQPMRRDAQLHSGGTVQGKFPVVGNVRGIVREKFSGRWERLAAGNGMYGELSGVSSVRAKGPGGRVTSVCG